MKASFRKLSGHSDVGGVFHWQLSLTAAETDVIEELFIPELFYDVIVLNAGTVTYAIGDGDWQPLPRACVKTIQTAQFRLRFQGRIKLSGTRLPLCFAERLNLNLAANQLVPLQWGTDCECVLSEFASEFEAFLDEQATKGLSNSLLNNALQETTWFQQYSARQKRRYYQKIFGISQKELRKIQNMHKFLGQACYFSTRDDPRILDNVSAGDYYDQPHLNRTFRELTGLTPVEYFQITSVLQDNLMAASYNESR